MAKNCQIIKEELTPIFLKLFQEMERDGTLPSSLNEARMIIPKSNKVATNKKEL
jgi:hypothetical protein